MDGDGRRADVAVVARDSVFVREAVAAMHLYRQASCLLAPTTRPALYDRREKIKELTCLRPQFFGGGMLIVAAQVSF